ncbi:hypothetical protein FOZ62_028344, partial [Perkinsus olseni]
FQVEHPSQADRVLEVIRYNLSGLDNEINSRTQGGLVRPAVVPVLEVLDPSKPLTMNPDYLTTITATIYLEVLPQWQPSIMAAPLALAVKTFFRTRLARADVTVRSGVLVTARVNETTPRAMTELLIDQDAFLDAVRLALGPGVSVGHSFPSLLVYTDESGGSSPAPNDTAVKETTFTILLIVILTAATVGCAVACCVIFKIVAQYKRSGAPRDFELGKAGEIASSRADEETTLDTTSISYVLPARSITMSDTCLSLEDCGKTFSSSQIGDGRKRPKIRVVKRDAPAREKSTLIALKITQIETDDLSHNAIMVEVASKRVEPKYKTG